MHDSTRQNASHQSGCYEICVKETIADKWLAWFEEFYVTRTDTGETLLTGTIVDQSALHGLLAKIRDLNLTLLAVNPIQSKTPHEK